MEKDRRQEALLQLLDLAAAKGYVTFDDVFDCGTRYALSIGDFDWLSESVTTRNIIVYETEPTTKDASDDVDDFAQIDYEETFQNIINVEPNLRPLIEEVRNIIPPQRGEAGRLKYQVKEGNQHACQRMIEMYMRVALRIAYARSRDYDTDLEATIGDAFVGLIYAVDKYDPDHSGPFVTYVSMWVYQNITREQTTRNPNVYFPVHRKELYFSAYPKLKAYGCIDCDYLQECQKARQMIMEKADTNANSADDVIMSMLPMLPFHKLAKEVRRCDYIYETTGEKIRFVGEASLYYSDDDMLDVISTDHRAERLQQVLNDMPERMRLILRGRLGLDGKERTLEDLGRQFGLTRERIRQIEKNGIRKLEYSGRAYCAQQTKKKKQEKTRGRSPKRRK